MKIEGLDAMRREATRFVANLAPRATATVIALSGELGAGKTTFTQGIAVALGIHEAVTSPTFVIEKVYELENQPFKRLMHIDAYRLKDAHELEVLGWKEVILDPSNLVIVEWPERVADIIPKDAIHASFEGSGDSREIRYN